MTNGTEVVWKPSQRSLADSNLIQFRDTINKAYNLTLTTYTDLHAWSVQSETFWAECCQYLEISDDGSLPTMYKLRSQMYPVQRFFPQLQLNYAEHCLRYAEPTARAIVEIQEDFQDVQTYSWGQLRRQVHLMQDILIGQGLTSCDNVAGVLSNSFHAIAIALAAASLGIAYSSVAPDMGVEAIVSRLQQSQPKAVFFHASTTYNRKVHNLLEKAREVFLKLKLPSLLPFIMVQDGRNSVALENASPFRSIDALISSIHRSPALRFERVSFNHPLFIMFSSGTTGPPKCIVHSHGGVLLQHKKEHVLNMELNKSDLYWQYTTTTWMMWQYQLTALATGAAILVYDGSPLLDIRAMIRTIDALGVTHFGTSPRWLAEITKQHIDVKALVSLSKLRNVVSTGSVLSAVQFRDFYSSWPEHIHLASISGGTDLLACFLLGNMISPVIAGELQCIGLGMSIKSFDEAGNEVFDEPGDLICDKPFPSQPIYFLADPQGHRYKNAYYSQFPKVWHHGDYLQLKPSGGAIILGRSDGVLNPSGVRFGSAEIYSVTAKIEEVEDALCVAQRRATDLDENVCLFLVLKCPLSAQVEEKVRHRIRTELSARHVPALIAVVTAIPVTGSGKKSETVVKQIISGSKVTAHIGIANTESLVQYEQYQHWDKRSKTPMQRSKI